MTGILTLSRPQAGVVSTFDARDYSLIDFLPIDHQWTALVQVGITLRIVFSDGSVIELLNFYSLSLVDDGSDDHTGTRADASGELLIETSKGLMSQKEFSETYWTTKSSGYVAATALGGHDGEQANGGLSGQTVPDIPSSAPTVGVGWCRISSAAFAATIYPAARDESSERPRRDHWRHGRARRRGRRRGQRRSGCPGC